MSFWPANLPSPATDCSARLRTCCSLHDLNCWRIRLFLFPIWLSPKPDMRRIGRLPITVSSGWASDNCCSSACHQKSTKCSMAVHCNHTSEPDDPWKARPVGTLEWYGPCNLCALGRCTMLNSSRWSSWREWNFQLGLMQLQLCERDIMEHYKSNSWGKTARTLFIAKVGWK